MEENIGMKGLDWRKGKEVGLGGQKSEAKVRAGGQKVVERFVGRSKHKTHITTMKRKLNEQDVPEATVETTSTKNAEKKETATTFGELGLDARLLQAITKEKFAAPTPVQARAIPLALSGKDILGKGRSIRW